MQHSPWRSGWASRSAARVAESPPRALSPSPPPSPSLVCNSQPYSFRYPSVSDTPDVSPYKLATQPAHISGTTTGNKWLSLGGQALVLVDKHWILIWWECACGSDFTFFSTQNEGERSDRMAWSWDSENHQDGSGETAAARTNLSLQRFSFSVMSSSSLECLCCSRSSSSCRFSFSVVNAVYWSLNEMRNKSPDNVKCVLWCHNGLCVCVWTAGDLKDQ